MRYLLLFLFAWLNAENNQIWDILYTMKENAYFVLKNSIIEIQKKFNSIWQFNSILDLKRKIEGKNKTESESETKTEIKTETKNKTKPKDKNKSSLQFKFKPYKQTKNDKKKNQNNTIFIENSEHTQTKELTKEEKLHASRTQWEKNMAKKLDTEKKEWEKQEINRLKKEDTEKWLQEAKNKWQEEKEKWEKDQSNELKGISSEDESKLYKNLPGLKEKIKEETEINFKHNKNINQELYKQKLMYKNKLENEENSILAEEKNIIAHIKDIQKILKSNISKKFKSLYDQRIKNIAELNTQRTALRVRLHEIEKIKNKLQLNDINETLAKAIDMHQ